MKCPICGKETPVLLLVDVGNGLQQMCRFCKSLRRTLRGLKVRPAGPVIEGSVEELPKREEAA